MTPRFKQGLFTFVYVALIVELVDAIALNLLDLGAAPVVSSIGAATAAFAILILMLVKPYIQPKAQTVKVRVRKEVEHEMQDRRLYW